jgi:hypothetical protein
MGVSDTHTAAAVQQGRDLVRGLREVVLRSGPTIATEIANQLSESGSHELPAALYALAEQATSPNGVDSMKSLASPQPTPCHRTVSGLDEPVTVHCLGPVSIVSHLGSSGWSDGDVKVFEKETLLTPELRKMIEDRNGFSIFDLLDSEDRQVAKRGRVLLRRGPSPEGVSRVEVGSLEWLDNAEAARQQAWGIQNRQEREQALAAVKEQYGGPPVVSRTMQVYPLSDKPRPVPRRPREQGALAGLPSPRDRPPARGRLFAEAVSSSRAPELPTSRPPELPTSRAADLPSCQVPRWPSRCATVAATSSAFHRG